MEYRIDVAGLAPDPDAVAATLQDADPAAMADLDGDGVTLRVATSIGLYELIAALDEAGIRVDSHRIALEPSICCGGCSG